MQRGENNPPVPKGEKAYSTDNISFASEPYLFCLLALAIATTVAHQSLIKL